MLTGVVLGSGGLLFLQKSYGPTRLTVEQSEQLHYDLNSANMDKQRQQSQLSQQSRELTEARNKLRTQTEQLTVAQQQVAKLTTDLQLFADAMPPDPRGTSPGIRAATFTGKPGELDYQILVMQDNGKVRDFSGQVELVVAGRYTRGKSANIELPPFPIQLQQYTHVHGSAPLPEGFIPRQVTVKITEGSSKKLSATRTLHVSR